MSDRESRIAWWMSRGVLLAVTGILGLISEKFLLDTTAQAGARGIITSSPLGLTIARVGLGGFPLACAIVVFVCLISANRIRFGLWFVIALFGTVLAVRIVGAIVDGSLAANVPLIIPEVVFLALTSVAIALGGGTRARTGGTP